MDDGHAPPLARLAEPLYIDARVHEQVKGLPPKLKPLVGGESACQQQEHIDVRLLRRVAARDRAKDARGEHDVAEAFAHP